MGRVSLVLDSGALTALAKGNISARVHLREALKAGRRIVVPTVVVVETTRGVPRDATVNRVINQSVVLALDITTGRAAGRLLHSARSKQTIDAIIVATADQIPGSVVLTCDERDIAVLAGVRSLTGVLSV